MSTVWFSHFSKGVYKGPAGLNSRNQAVWNTDLPLSGRHSFESKRPAVVGTAQGFRHRIPSISWLGDKYAEKSTSSNTRFDIFGSQIPNERSSGKITRIEKRKDKEVVEWINEKIQNNGQRSEQCVGSVEFRNSHAKMGQMARQTTATVFSQTMEENGSELGSEHSNFSSSEERDEVVVSGSEFNQRKIVKAGKLDIPDNRFQSSWLGGPHRSDISTRHLGGRGKFSASQRFGAQSSKECNRRVAVQSLGHSSANQIRQCGNSDIYKKARRYSKRKIVSRTSTHHEVGRTTSSGSDSCSYSRERQSVGGFPEPQISLQTRVGAESGSISADSQDMGAAKEGSNGSLGESESREVLLPFSVSPSGSMGCFESGLESASVVHISSISSHSESSEKDQGRESQCDSSNSRLAQTNMVPIVETVGCGQTNNTSSEVRSLDSGGTQTSLPSEITSKGLEIERNRLTQEGFLASVVNTMLASRKPTTNKTYERVWKTFTAWLLKKGVTPDQVTICQVLDFLQDGLDSNLSVRTLKLQTSAISAITEVQWAKNPRVAKFLAGALHIRPPTRSLSATWSLPLVLERLTLSPFEPLQTIPDMLLTLKTVFLVAVTSSRRVSDLQ
uniref:Core-binding (CB) domain-containing protein n=1 Tax=Xenopus tropicalis TaxID=8364 RepID=A0A803JIG1_XENTR